MNGMLWGPHALRDMHFTRVSERLLLLYTAPDMRKCLTHSPGGQGVVGSNPASPTEQKRRSEGRLVSSWRLSWLVWGPRGQVCWVLLCRFSVCLQGSPCGLLAPPDGARERPPLRSADNPSECPGLARV